MKIENKFLFPACKSEVVGKSGRRSIPLNKPMSHDSARRSLLEAVKTTTSKNEEEHFGLHSCRVGALTEAANSGKFSEIQLQNIGRWAQMDLAAWYFLPREKEQGKVGKILGTRPMKSLKTAAAGQSLEALLNSHSSKAKAEVSEENNEQLKTSNQRLKLMKIQLLKQTEVHEEATDQGEGEAYAEDKKDEARRGRLGNKVNFKQVLP